MWIQQASLAQKEGSHPNENRLSRSRSRSGVVAHRSIDQYTTLEDESETRPPTSHQGRKPGGRRRHATGRRYHNDTGDSTARRRNPVIPREQGSGHGTYLYIGGSIHTDTNPQPRPAAAAVTLAVPRQLWQVNRTKDPQKKRPHKQALDGEQEEAKDEDETEGEFEELVIRVPQRTVRLLATVQLTVLKVKSGLLRGRGTHV